jgi:hypothetical protein
MKRSDWVKREEACSTEIWSNAVLQTTKISLPAEQKEM